MAPKIKKVDHEVWEQTTQDLYKNVLNAPTPKQRERWLALFFVASGASLPTMAKMMGRSKWTLHIWIEAYNIYGPTGVLEGEKQGESEGLFLRLSRSATLRAQARKETKMLRKLNRQRRKQQDERAEEVLVLGPTASLPEPARRPPPALKPRAPKALGSVFKEVPSLDVVVKSLPKPKPPPRKRRGSEDLEDLLALPPLDE